MSRFKQFLESLGGLHDARVSKITFDVMGDQLTLEVDDIYSNFEGLPGYKGAKPGHIVFRGISQLTVGPHSNPIESNIYDLSVSQETGEGGTALIKFWPEGRITVAYGHVDFPNLEPSTDSFFSS